MLYNQAEALHDGGVIQVVALNSIILWQLRNITSIIQISLVKVAISTDYCVRTGFTL